MQQEYFLGDEVRERKSNLRGEVAEVRPNLEAIRVKFAGLTGENWFHWSTRQLERL